MKMNNAQRVQKHRALLRAAGLRPVQIWVPDTRNGEFVKECQRQSRLLKDDPQESEILHLMEKIADISGWE